MDEFNKQNLGPSQPAIGTGEGEVPLATPAQMPDLMRTAASDLRTLQESGGQTVKPYVPETVSPAAFAPQTPAAAPAQSANEPMFTPPSPIAPATAEIGKVPAKQHQKGLVGGLVAFVIVIALAAAGYFFVYPMFFGQSAEEIPAVTPPAQTEVLPATPGENPANEPIVPIVPIATSSGEAATTTPAITTETHTSLLNKPTDANQEKTITTVNADNLKNGIVDTTTETATIKEINLKSDTGAPITFTEIMTTLLPTVFTSETAGQFENYKYSVVVFSNSQGAWLNYIGQAKSGTDLAALKNKINLLEAANLSTVFLKDSGSQQGEWKSGTINRYLVFSQNNSALNYGWFGDKLLITTSYPAWQALSAAIQ